MLGQTMEEGTIVKWFKQEGDIVEKGEPLYEVLTDKVNMEVESPESGVLRKIVAKVDDTIPIMELVAIIGTADEPIDELLSTPGSEEPELEEETLAVGPPIPAMSLGTPPQSVSPSRVFISPRARRLAHDAKIDIDALAGLGTGPEGRVTEKDVRSYIAEVASVKATPLAATIADKHGISLKEIAGSGPQGRVMRDDVLQVVAPTAMPLGRTISFTGMRKMVADAVTKSAQTAPHVTLVLEVDMTPAVAMRTQVVEKFEKQYGTRLTYTDLIVKAAALALVDHPIMNASLKGAEIIVHDEINIGLAVAIETGLIVPVIHGANNKTIAQISSEAKVLGEKARTSSLTADQLSGGTFTITNLGAFGIDVFDPIIVTDQAAILGVCRIAEKPAVVDGQVCVRSMMNLCLSFDHRVLDGVPAARFLQSLKLLLESPWQLVI
jgi:pyruvate dehydrogenase E2 component (dihydrolipoamide acetyltransferase)